MARKLANGKITDDGKRTIARKARCQLEQWVKDNLPSTMVGKFLTRRFEVKASDGSDAIIKRDFYKETSSKHQDDPLYPVKLEYARNAHNLFENAHYVRPEVSIDHPFECEDGCYRIEFKVRKNSDGNFLHILRIYKK